ncbi:MAG TPA: alcohol dehydrogenase catalytic domain-containing protein, partial [Ilumatobacteraceae bacterium]|nr:alcohol dehydrogenase catalytic domain-containing protein [Ilumatobacteraceae bacterium]
MRKLVTESFGSLDDLLVVEGPDLEPAPGQVVVDVAAAGVNFVDGLIVQGRYQFTPPLPHTPGTEVAGTVIEVAPDVTSVKVGDRVLGGRGSGCYAEQVIVGGDVAFK